MSNLEGNIIDWSRLVEPIVKAWESEGAQRIAEEKRLAGIQSARELTEAQEAKTALEATRTKTWDLLEGFNPRELLEGLNRSMGIWRSKGTIKGIEFNPESVAYHLSFAFPGLTFYPGSSDGEGEPTPAHYIAGGRSTSLRIGVVHSEEKWVGYAQNYDNRLYWENIQNFQREGYGLYVYDSDANLNSVEGADTFKDIQPNLGYSVASWPQKGGNSGIIIDAGHPKAKEILVELLARSCINRARINSLPWQMQERERARLDDAFRQGHFTAEEYQIILCSPTLKLKGHFTEEESRAILLSRYPKPKPQGFWSRLFGE